MNDLADAVLRSKQVAVMEQTYPGWHVEVVRKHPDRPERLWRATRRTELTKTQRKAGLLAVVEGDSPFALLTLLGGQDLITHRGGGR